MILYSTTSSPEASLASNLQCATVLLNSLKAGTSPIELEVMNPAMKKLWMEAREAEVIGPVESGDLMIAKKGPRRVVRGKFSTSVIQ